ncbi:MAG: hypothetical protein ACK4ND_05795 [Cytophagaceae bacterium]
MKNCISFFINNICVPIAVMILGNVIVQIFDFPDKNLVFFNLLIIGLLIGQSLQNKIKFILTSFLLPIQDFEPSFFITKLEGTLRDLILISFNIMSGFGVASFAKAVGLLNHSFIQDNLLQLNFRYTLFLPLTVILIICHYSLVLITVLFFWFKSQILIASFNYAPSTEKNKKELALIENKVSQLFD